MAYKWTEGEARPANLDDVDGFNRSYNSLKGEINGGLDRENLKDETVEDTHLAQNAFVKYVLKDAITLQNASTYTQEYFYTMGSLPTQDYFAMAYDNYSGGWITNTAQQISDTFEEGMLHIDFNCWYWLASHFSNKTQQIWCQFQITVDGNPVVVSGKHFQNVGTIHLVADIPIASGNHVVAIRWRFTSWMSTRTTTSPVFYYDGGQLLALNRYR